MMMNFIKYSDRVKIACQPLLTNISACIMTEKKRRLMGSAHILPFEIGERATEMLIEMVEGEAETHHELLPYKMIDGETL